MRTSSLLSFFIYTSIVLHNYSTIFILCDKIPGDKIPGDKIPGDKNGNNLNKKKNKNVEFFSELQFSKKQQNINEQEAKWNPTNADENDKEDKKRPQEIKENTKMDEQLNSEKKSEEINQENKKEEEKDNKEGKEKENKEEKKEKIKKEIETLFEENKKTLDNEHNIVINDEKDNKEKNLEENKTIDQLTYDMQFNITDVEERVSKENSYKNQRDDSDENENESENDEKIIYSYEVTPHSENEKEETHFHDSPGSERKQESKEENISERQKKEKKSVSDKSEKIENEQIKNAKKKKVQKVVEIKKDEKNDEKKETKTEEQKGLEQNQDEYMKFKETINDDAKLLNVIDGGAYLEKIKREMLNKKEERQPGSLKKISKGGKTKEEKREKKKGEGEEGEEEEEDDEEEEEEEDEEDDWEQREWEDIKWGKEEWKDEDGEGEERKEEETGEKKMMVENEMMNDDMKRKNKQSENNEGYANTEPDEEWIDEVNAEHMNLSKKYFAKYITEIKTHKYLIVLKHIDSIVFFINVTYQNKDILKSPNFIPHVVPLSDLKIINEDELLRNDPWENIKNSENPEELLLPDITSYSDFSKVDIDPRIFRDWYMYIHRCRGNILPVQSTIAEKICYLASWVKHNPAFQNYNKTIIKPATLKYKFLFNILKKIDAFGGKQCIKDIEESDIFGLALDINNELIEESKKEKNFGKCMNNVILKNRKLYPIILTLISLACGCFSLFKESYYLSDEQKEAIQEKKQLIDLPIFNFLNENAIEIFIPKNVSDRIDVHVKRDIFKASAYKRAIYRVWYMCFLFIHKTYLLNKFWLLLEKWKVTDYLPHPWKVQHIGGSIIPQITHAVNKLTKKKMQFRYLEQNIYFMHTVKKKNYERANYDHEHYYSIENIISFRGSATPKTWLLNTMFVLTTFKELDTKGKVHKGYKVFFSKTIAPYLKKLAETVLFDVTKENSSYTEEHPYTIIFTGHSFGAAMAQLSAFYFSKMVNLEKHKNVIKVYCITFALPTFYDVVFYKDFRTSGCLIHNVNVDYDPVYSMLAIPVINNFYNADEDIGLMIKLKVNDLCKLNYSVGENPYFSNEIFNEKNYNRGTTAGQLFKWIFKKNIFLGEKQLDAYQTHFFFYFSFLTLLSGWADKAEWGSFFFSPFFTGPSFMYTHYNLVELLQKFHNKYMNILQKKNLVT